MNNLTSINIRKPANEVFEAFVDPVKIGNFWFSSSSERWEPGKTIIIKYDEYNAEGDLKILEIEKNKKIVFEWVYSDENNHVVTITLKESDHASTIVEINEEGFSDKADEALSHLIDNKEGWVYTLTCLKGYLEFGVSTLRAALVKE